MQLLNPWFFLLSIFLAAVVLFYFFRKRYEEQTVPSNLLWEEVQNEWQASPLLKKLQKNLLFWLQIVALFFLMIALVGPYWVKEKLKGEHLIIIIDSSATMSAEYDGLTRFERAKSEILDMIDQVNGQKVTLIEAGDRPEILLSGEKDPSAMKKKLESIELSYNHESMGKAVDLAYSLSSGNDGVIYIFSDSVKKDHFKDAPKEQYIEVHNVGKETDNISLNSFGVGLYNEEIAGAAVIENQSSEEKNVDFIIRSTTEGSPLFKKNITLSSQEQLVLQIPDLPEKPYYEGVILANDGYETDNTMTAILLDSNHSIYALGDLNPFLVKGFQTIGAKVFQADTESAVAGKKGVFLVESSSLQDLPSQPVILINSGKEKLSLKEAITAEKDPLLQYVDYKNIYISQASKGLDGGFQPLLSSGSIPLIEKGMHNGQPIIIVNFSLAHSDWTLKPSFPIFLFNAYQWLSQQSDFQGFFEPGEEKWLNVSNDSPPWGIYNSEDKNLYTLNLQKERFRAPQKPGIYQAVSGEEIRHFSVTLDEREKNPAVEASFTVNEYKEDSSDKEKGRNDHIWFWLSLVALALIAVEWEVYRRGYRN